MIENEPMPADNEPEWPTKEEWYAEQDCDEEWINQQETNHENVEG